MKEFLRAAVPGWMLGIYRRRREAFREARAADRALDEIFDEVYRARRWGGSRQAAPFFSGHGSDPGIASRYAEMVRRFIADHGIRSVADLGCGDYRVGALIAPAVERYTGIDVVPRLVDWLSETHGRPGVVDFRCADLSRDPLPEADLYLVRQVLQHLSNARIAGFLANLPPQGWLIVTEQQPEDERLDAPNLDKWSGGTTRLGRNSGVYLERPPFELPGFEAKLLEVAGTGPSVHPEGLIRSFLFRLGEAAPDRTGG
ncbi:MAG: trans-aconitate 2-methyltransferase [Sphingomonadales bacterium]